MEAVVDLLGDHGQPEEAEHLVEAPLLRRHGQPAALGVRRHHLGAGEHPGQVRGLSPQLAEHRVVVGLDPVGQRAAEVHQRVAEGGHLPVEDAADPQRVVVVEHDVVEPEVVVDHAGRHVVGLVLVEPGHHGLEVADVVGAGPAVALAPAGHLPADVARALAEVGQPGRLDVDGVQLDEHVEEAAAQRSGVDLAQRHPRRQVGPQDRARQLLHDVEVRPDHGVVLAEGDHRRHVAEHRRQPGLDGELAAHVVGAARLGPARRAAQDQLARGVGELEGQVGRAAGELAYVGGAVEAVGVVGVLAQPGGHRGDVEGVLVADGARGVVGVGRRGHRSLRSFIRSAVLRISAL